MRISFFVICRRNFLLMSWLLVGAILTSLAVLLLISSPLFDWSLPVKRMPAVELGLGLAIAGAVYLTVLPLIRASVSQPPNVRRLLFWLIIGIGLGMRLILFFSVPAMEDDYNRYLWEGALVANGISPYAVSPLDGRRAEAGSPLYRVAQQSGGVVFRVNHPRLTSTYPPVAQVAFALAHIAAPWNLYAWRGLSLACDIAIAAILTILLKHIGRSSIWSALYWWNPLVIKELINSAHMEGVLMLLVLLALLLAARGKKLGSLFLLGLAVGTKLWPVLLAPLLLRPFWQNRRLLAIGALLFSLLVALWALPPYFGGLDQHSGFVAYAQNWKTNSALSPLIERLSATLLSLCGWEQWAWALTRGLIGLALIGFSVQQAWRPLQNGEDLLQRAAIVTAALVLLSPAQFPWYMIWMLPLLVFLPISGLLAVTVTAPLYYASFHFLTRGAYEIFADYVVWLIWLPIWLLLGARVWRHRIRHSKNAINERSNAFGPNLRT